MDNYIVIHRVELTAEEAAKATTGEVDLTVLMARRPTTFFAVILEKDFAAVAGMHAIPNPPETGKGNS